MALDLVMILVFGLFVALGAWRGAIASAAGLVCLGLGYLAAFACATHLSEILAYQLGLQSVVATLLAGTLGFTLAFGLLSIAFGWVRYLQHAHAMELPEKTDRVVGGLFGGLRGALVVVLVAWLVSWADAARDFGGAETMAAIPDASSSTVASLSGSVVEQAVEVALGEDEATARVAARIAARPAVAMSSIQQLLDDPRLQQVQEDQHFWTLVENGASESALNQGSFYGITHDAELREHFAALGLVSAEAVENTETFKDEVRSVLDQVGPRIKGLKDDPELEALARDPQILAMLEDGDTLGLIQHPAIRRVASRAAEGL